MRKTPNTISLRDATPADAEFVNTLTRTAMAKYVEETWTSPDEHEAYFQKNLFDLQTTKIIQVAGKDVGRWSVLWSDEFVLIDNIHLLPEFQGTGIGKALIQEIVSEAHNKRLFAKLQLLKVNPAKSLYERLGFKVYNEDAERLYMRTGL